MSTEIKAITPAEEIRSSLGKMEKQFKLALPSHISPEKFTRVAITAITSNPELLQADRQSLYASCMKSAQDGLLPDGREAALVVFNTNIAGKGKEPKWVKKVQYMPMVGGILKKVRNSGELASLSPHEVYQNDVFEYWVDEKGEHLKHIPLLSGDRGNVVHVYVIASTKDGAVYIEVMSKTEIEKVREVSKAKNSSPWMTWWGEMAKKTVIRRLAKRLPMSTDLDQAINSDEEYDVTPSEEAPQIAESATKSNRLEKLMTTTQEAPAQEVEQNDEQAEYEEVL